MSSEDTAGDVAIRVRDVSKHFLLFDRPQDRLKQSIVPRLQRLAGRPPTRYYRDFAALSGVSFEVRRGETVGIVGRNGSGKSTLLQVVCGTLRPNAGSVAVNGRIAALLELGAGFNPEFTGRENVYLNAAILGLSREETDARFDDIARFADIGDFIGQPVKTYSSGMYVRLAFATAINVDPDILVVDEALSVGDEAFQRKCFARIEQIQERGGTILFVTHSAQLVVQLCSRALLMDRGELIMDGKPKAVTSHYQRLINLSGAEAEATRKAIRSNQVMPEIMLDPARTSRSQPALAPSWDSEEATNEWFDPTLKPTETVEYESSGAVISDVHITTIDGKKVNVLRSGVSYFYRYTVKFLAPARRVSFGMMIKSTTGLELGGGWSIGDRRKPVPEIPSNSVVHIRFRFDCVFLPGVYFTNAGTLFDNDGDHCFAHRILDAAAFRVEALQPTCGQGLVNLNPMPEIKIETISMD